MLVPIYLVGISTSILGSLWLVASEPWLLDKAANEILLQTTYEELFAADINTYLGDYLTGLYRFFGWWIFVIGLMILVYVHVTRFTTRQQQTYFYAVLFIIIAGLYTLQLQFIPSSPFLWTSHGLSAMFLISFIASRRLKDGEDS
jgi:lipopolysaccharide export LptBFGC system permease protein LptF